MPAITIRDVPATTRDELAARAARRGQSLQQYLRRELEAMAQNPDRTAVLERMRRRAEASETRLSGEDIVAYLAHDREHEH